METKFKCRLAGRSWQSNGQTVTTKRRTTVETKNENRVVIQLLVVSADYLGDHGTAAVKPTKTTTNTDNINDFIFDVLVSVNKSRKLKSA